MNQTRTPFLGVPLLALSVVATAMPSWGAAPQRLTLPVELPQRLQVEVQFEDTSRTLHLERHSLRSPLFQAWAWEADGTMAEARLLTPATYRGTLVGEPTGRVVAHLHAGGMNAHVFFDDGPTWTIEALEGEDRSSGTAQHEVRAGHDPSPWPTGGHTDWCGTEDRLGPPPVLASTGGTTQHLAEIALDVTNPFYVLNGSSVPDTIAAAEAQLNLIDFLFARSALITYTLTHIIVRTAPFYPPEGNLMELFADEWNTNQSGVQRDVAHLIAYFDGGIGGVAMTGTLCDLTEAYSWSAGPPVVMAHELAHNWNSLHCHDVDVCNIMCRLCFSFGFKTKREVETFRDSVGCLDDVGPHPNPFPPYPDPDVAELTRDEIAGGGATRTLDVLANDHDGNLDPLAIDAFDTGSVRGGTIALSPGTGGGGADELVYTAPSAVFPGNDRATYTAGDGIGGQTVGHITLRVVQPGLAGYWKLEGNLFDASGGGRTGSPVNGPSYITGVYGQAFEFTGSNYIFMDGFGVDLHAATISTWVRRDGAQDAFAGLVGGSGVNGLSTLSVNDTHELRYRWGDNDPAASGWDSGLVLPDLQWVFVALVVESDKATMYLHDGVTLQSAVNPIEHRRQDFLQIFFGSEEHESVRFKGALDDVRIYRHALTVAEITALHDLGGRALDPDPPESGGALPGSRRLSWSAGLEALSHDVYFGADFTSVRDATQLSPEFVANTTQSEILAPPPLFPGDTYHWRVDEVTSGGTVTGQVRVFQIDGPLARWPLDEGAGATASDVAGGLDGTYRGTPLLDQPPAQPELGRSVELDGIDDWVQIPPLNLDGNAYTFALWVRRDGPQTDDAMLFGTRSASTVAGINVAANGNLRYKWNDDGFGSFFLTTGGLVLPDGIWALVVMVVAPDTTTVYMGSQDALSSPHILFVPNGREEFDGTFNLGHDPGLDTYFKGRIDDMRIYPFSMSESQVEALFARARSAGRVPDGADVAGNQLALDRLPTGDVSLSWSDSCNVQDSDYAVYEGVLGDFASHLPAVCSSGGATSTTVTPQPGDRYYLVVPKSSSREGGYGTDSTGQPRPASVAACRVQYTTPCN